MCHCMVWLTICYQFVSLIFCSQCNNILLSIYTQDFLHTHTHTCTHTQTHMHTQTHTQTHISTHKHTNKHTDARTQTHTYTHSYIRSYGPMSHCYIHCHVESCIYFSNYFLYILAVILKPMNISQMALGSSINYTCESSITSPMVYQWKHNESILENETSPNLTITNVQWNETGKYYCMVTAKSDVSVKSNKVYLNITGSGKQIVTTKNHN